MHATHATKEDNNDNKNNSRSFPIILMMKRGLHKELAPGLWAGIGGHLDISDIHNPRALDLSDTCYREIQEETGITRSDIKVLRLKYIAIRKDQNEIRVHHFYFGKFENEIHLPKCDEGELYWIERSKLLDLPMSATNKEALNHWIKNPDNEKVYVISITPQGDSAVVSEV